MKKWWGYVFLPGLFLVSMLGFSQAPAQEIAGKAVLGINGAEIAGDDFGGFDKIGLVIGGAVTLPLSKKVGLQPEILYTQKGSRSMKNEPYFNWRLNYIEMPLFFNYKVDKRLLVQAGPSVNYLLRSRYDDGDGFHDVDDKFKGFDWAAHLGVEFMLLPPILSANLRYQHSFIPISENSNFYNKTLMLSLRCNFTTKP